MRKSWSAALWKEKMGSDALCREGDGKTIKMVRACIRTYGVKRSDDDAKAIDITEKVMERIPRWCGIILRTYDRELVRVIME